MFHPLFNVLLIQIKVGRRVRSSSYGCISINNQGGIFGRFIYSLASQEEED